MDVVCGGTTYGDLAPLQPGTLYHYRFAGANADGTTCGRSPAGVARRGLRVGVEIAATCPCSTKATLTVTRRALRRAHSLTATLRVWVTDAARRARPSAGCACSVSAGA